MLDRAKFYAAIRGRGTLFPDLTSGQVAGTERVLDTWEHNSRDFVENRHLAYCLATAYHETAQTMQPIAEIGRGRGKAYGNPSPPYNKAYYGRGLVQLTWWYNYVRAQIELADLGIKLDLVRDPDAALSPTGAPEILLYGMTQGWFTGAKLTDYFNHSANNPVGARAIVNGADRAQTIAGYYTQFLSAIRGAQPK